MAEESLTPHQAKLFAHELTLKRAADDFEKLTTALMDAQVDLNPHQVDAALFAFKSPLSKGAILADEVGLGKTIEAGLVMTQKWAEGKRHILVICPASLRPQWRDEMAEKFFLPAEVIESKAYNAAMKAGSLHPFDRSGATSTVLICSLHFAAGKEMDLLSVPWDLVVVDEAHRLRNVYKPDNKIGKKIRGALANVPKILLTATPLQNSLMELYGLVSIIDEHAFGDAKTFRARYSRVSNDSIFSDLKARLAPLCHRTLRRQVTEYVKYTNRVPLTQEFRPSPDEQVLYDLVSEYLRRPGLYGLPSGQRALLTLVLRKLLASSTFAIAGALDTLSRRLASTLREFEQLASAHSEEDTPQLLADDVDHFQALADEWPDDDEPTDVHAKQVVDSAATEAELEALRLELGEIEALRDQAVSITENAKGEALLAALGAAFRMGRELGANEKAIIFTESRRTQDYLVRLLTESGHGDGLMLFNGSNNDERAKEIYRRWMGEHAGTDRVTGSRAADIRSALVDEFRNDGKIMIATEAAAEGINLQFCSIVINYDLPWNPQRIEQRIGRCHRYGQEHDVVVVNFLNRDNAADQRVFELLDEKFKLFSGVFGASDEILGAVQSGVDIEKRIVDIYQRCRQPDEIDREFTQLRLELDEQIEEVMADTRQKLLENFDAEVHDRLKVNLASSRKNIGRAEELLWRLSKEILAEYARFDDEERSFTVTSVPLESVGFDAGDVFHLGNRQVAHSHKYRLGHLLAQWVIEAAKQVTTPDSSIVFDYSGWNVNAIALEPFVGCTGSLVVEKLVLAGSEIEEHLLIVAVTDDQRPLDPEAARRMFDLPADVMAEPFGAALDSTAAIDALDTRRSEILADLACRQATWFDQEIDKFDRWADDQRHALRVELKDLDADIRDLKRSARTAGALPEKLALQRKIRDVESRRDQAWREYDDSAREVEVKKDELLDQVEERLSTETTTERLFAARWELK